jgi:UDP-N-acetylglucosamine transferase subunit ALG13
MIFVAVGTFLNGFDELVAAADEAAAELSLRGFAQIGHSQAVPRHLEWERFLAPEALTARMAAARLVVCHGGMGVLGEAMRLNKPIIAVPRRGRPTRTSPAGDQTALVRRLAASLPIRVCERPDELVGMIGTMLDAGPERPRYPLGSDVPQLLARFLAGDPVQSLPARSS